MENINDFKLLNLIKRADDGDEDALFLYIQYYLMDESASKNEGLKEKYDEYVKRLAASGQPGAYIFLAEMAKDSDVADAYYVQAAEGGETVQSLLRAMVS